MITQRLATYGEPRYMDLMRRIVRLQRDGTFELDLDAFVHHAGGATMTWDDGEPTMGPVYTKKLEELLRNAEQQQTS